MIGGGAAGLGGALALGRARRSVLVLDSGQPRNAPAQRMHAYPGRNGTPPAEYLSDVRREASGYGVRIEEGTVVGVDRDDQGFRVALADGGSVHAARLLVTTGLVDELPDVPGVAELWGRDVLHCPYCHGWEVRDQAIGVLATTPLAVHAALMWRQWSKDITLFLHTLSGLDELGDDKREELAARDITVVTGEVVSLEAQAGRLSGVRLADGEVRACQALVVAPHMTARAAFLTTLGLEPVEQEMHGTVIGSRIPVDPGGQTTVPGVWAAGNITNLSDQVIGSAAAGVRAGAAINADLTAEETRRAVAARRALFSAEVESQVCERVLGTRRHGL
ncbi:thioredoxin reductase [Sinosporangium siamense]|uniref:Thioredoxin reductase n=1 Tax=Sinosporangium siamense TaxID=1367973 RepID=A0A919RNG4_9ACTN|nr:thioredoxin reductase [Sinosporangium siamense]